MLPSALECLSASRLARAGLNHCSGGWHCAGRTGPAFCCRCCLVLQEIKERCCSLRNCS